MGGTADLQRRHLLRQPGYRPDHHGASLGRILQKTVQGEEDDEDAEAGGGDREGARYGEERETVGGEEKKKLDLKNAVIKRPEEVEDVKEDPLLKKEFEKKVKAHKEKLEKEYQDKCAEITAKVDQEKKTMLDELEKRKAELKSQQDATLKEEKGR